MRKRTPTIATKLSAIDFIKFEAFCRMEGKTKTEIAREAILLYLKVREAETIDEHDARRELKWLSDLSCEDTRNKSEPDFDKLITGLGPVERELHLAVRKDLEQLEKEGFVLPKDDRLNEKQQQVLDNVREIFLTAYDGKQRDRVIEPTPQRDELPPPNPLETTRTFEPAPLSERIRSDYDERNKDDEPHTHDERSR